MVQGAGSRVATGRFQAMGQTGFQPVQPHRELPDDERAAVGGERDVVDRGDVGGGRDDAGEEPRRPRHGHDLGRRGVVAAQVAFERHVLKPGLIFKGKGLKPVAFKLWVNRAQLIERLLQNGCYRTVLQNGCYRTVVTERLLHRPASSTAVLATKPHCAGALGPMFSMPEFCCSPSGLARSETEVSTLLKVPPTTEHVVPAPVGWGA
jgi:hypothetical protein